MSSKPPIDPRIDLSSHDAILEQYAVLLEEVKDGGFDSKESSGRYERTMEILRQARLANIEKGEIPTAKTTPAIAGRVVNGPFGPR